MSEVIVRSEIPDQATVADTLGALRMAGVLGDTYADFSTVLDLRDEDAAYDRYESIGRFLAASFDATRWWVADWLIFGEGAFGERFYQAADVTGLSESTLVDYARIALRVPRSRRRSDLHFSHHRAVAKLDPEAQTYWLERAVNESLSTRELGEAIVKAAEREAAEEDADPASAVVEVVRIQIDRAILARLVHESQALGDGFVKVPEEAIARLRAAIGEEER